MILRRLVLSLVIVFTSAVSALAQSSILVTTNNTITTFGADCSVTTNCVIFATRPLANNTVQITGLTTGTLQFEGTIDSVNWTSVQGTNLASGTAVTSTTANGTFQFAAALVQLRIRASALSAGTPVINLLSTAAGGGGGGGGGGGTASQVKILDSGGANLATVNSSGQLFVNCQAGCAAAGDTVGSSVVLNALNTAATVALAGENGASVVFTSSTSPVLTVTPEISTDGGTTWSSAVLIDPFAGTISTTRTNPPNETWGIGWTIGGVSNVRVRTSSFTSGSVTATLRSTVTRPYVTLFGTDGTNLRQVAVTTTGLLSQNLSQVGGANISLGQAVMGTSVPVAIASNQSNLPENLAQIGGNNVVTAAVGVQRVGIVGSSNGIVDFVGQNAASPANAILMGAQFNTTPTTIASGNVSPLQVDNAGNLLVNIKLGAGSGGTALADANAFTQGPGGTNFTPAGCEFNSSPTNLATGTAGAFLCTAGRLLKVDLSGTAANATALAANVTQFGGVAVNTGTGASGTGTPRVTVANDSQIKLWDGTTAVGVNADTGLNVHVINGSTTVPENGAITAGNTNVAETVSTTYGFGGTTWQRINAVGNSLNIGGAAASGAAKAGNPVQIGGVFNTTQPSPSSGQVVEAQSTGRGALIVASGVDNTTANAWFAKITDGTNTNTVKAASTASLTTDTSLVVQPAPIAAPICTSFQAISQTGSTRIVVGASAKKIYVCMLTINANAAETVNVIEGQGTTCATSPTAIYGSTTTANGMAIAANSGWANTAGQPYFVTATALDDLCLTQVGGSRVTGSISYVVQ